jgi:hypothetical protein
MNQLEEDWEDAYTDVEKDKSCKIVEFWLPLWVQGGEIMKPDISGFLKYLDVGAQDLSHPHVIVPLIGYLKGENGERYHMMVMARMKMSREWQDVGQTDLDMV